MTSRPRRCGARLPATRARYWATPASACESAVPDSSRRASAPPPSLCASRPLHRRLHLLAAAAPLPARSPDRARPRFPGSACAALHAATESRSELSAGPRSSARLRDAMPCGCCTLHSTPRASTETTAAAVQMRGAMVRGARPGQSEPTRPRLRAPALLQPGVPAAVSPGLKRLDFRTARGAVFRCPAREPPQRAPSH